ncbi:hypothetical protein FACS1894216_08320 [Synergistales bacterium]|nr:hypothetical protein FACS1894216_08320 [Synergistales bacterium]
MQASEMENDTLAGGHRNIKNRAIYNLCDLHSAQQGKGVEYENLLRSFQITFCGYTVFRRKKFVNRFSFRNEDGDVLQDTVGIVFIELSKLSGLLSKAPHDMSPLEMRSVFLAFADKPERCEIVNGVISAKEEIKLASELLLNISQDENERAHFRSRRMLQMDHEHDMIARYNKGQSDMARNLLKAGVSPDIIASSSGLSINEILALRD